MSFNSSFADCTFKKHRKSGDTVYALTQISSNRIMVKKLPVTHPPLVLKHVLNCKLIMLCAMFVNLKKFSSEKKGLILSLPKIKIQHKRPTITCVNEVEYRREDLG